MDSELFEYQFLRYAQVLNVEKVEKDEYLTLYSCTESARYYNKATGEEYKDYVALKKKGLVERVENQPAGSDTITNWKFSDSVRVEPVYKDRVQVYQRIDI